MFKTIVGENSFSISMEGNNMMINDEPVSWDLIKTGERSFHILHQHKSYQAEVVKADPVTNIFSIKINGKVYDVIVKDKMDLLLEKMGMTAVNSNRVNNLKAPMPGLILELKVKEGDTVNQDDPLIVLEAMKMENVIKSSGSGVVKSIKVKKGDSVEKGQVMIEF